MPTKAPGQITRRAALAFGAIGAGILLAPLGSTKARAEPKRGGTLRVAMAHGSTTDSYDPATWDQAFSQTFATARHGYLTEIAGDGSLAPSIAESWQPAPNAATWRFKIQSGITFHSGKTLTVDDVIASIDYHRGADSKSPAKPIVEGITSMAAEGNTLVITLKAENADFPFVLLDDHLCILPSAAGKIDPTSADGCGPYVVQSFEPGVSAKMTRNPNYWKSDRAHFDAVEMLSIPDNTARQNALLTGEVDVIDQPPLNTIEMMKRAPGIKILTASGPQHYSFAMDTRAAPFSDNNVRLALKWAIDRQELVDKILYGYGEIGNDQPIGRSNRYLAADLPQKAYDADKAKFYLKKAGLNDLKVQLSTSDAGFAGAVDAGVLYSEKAAAAGINIEVVREPNDGYWEQVWMKKPFCAVYWGGRPTEDWMFSTAYAAGAPWNDTFWNNDRFNKLLLAARSELDDAKRRGMYHEMQAIVADDGGAVVPMFASYVMATSDRIAHPDAISANKPLDGFRALERWWFV
ncbi:ABC transporter substrate-binding protein [Mesorhizobium sp.]|uniref:ABC transporter substrate-binding protein n=1 Tax=Mesorhizobium sp. TaxID=1871066 RepID=UPI000FE5C770|nr:ABC transporter substrate-binding protein [Mesorhizobium sp.]RWP96677.1 MAG: ABC transporter substrate-binding protein [Mesorhizobium sp.]